MIFCCPTLVFFISRGPLRGHRRSYPVEGRRLKQCRPTATRFRSRSERKCDLPLEAADARRDFYEHGHVPARSFGIMPRSRTIFSDLEARDPRRLSRSLPEAPAALPGGVRLSSRPHFSPAREARRCRFVLWRESSGFGPGSVPLGTSTSRPPKSHVRVRRCVVAVAGW